MLLFACSVPATADEQSFRAEMLERLKLAQPDATFTAGDEPLVIKVSGGSWEEAVINLHRIHGYCQNASTPDCEAVKAEFVQRTMTRPDKPTPETLRVIVRDQEYMDYIEQLEEQAKEAGLQAIRRPLGGGLYAILVNDAPTTLALAGTKALTEMNLDEAAAWDRGWRQTQAILPEIRAPSDLREEPMAFEGEEYFASLLADIGAWQKIAEVAGPDLFVTAVSDQFVFAGVMPDGPRLDDLKKTVEEDCLAAPRCISPHIYRFRKGQWVIAR
ncbi:MAG: hypothetical protein H2056_06020 [Sphingopyxis sp.]|nr:hypothetical protein [Sphingopyxis sp.]